MGSSDERDGRLVRAATTAPRSWSSRFVMVLLFTLVFGIISFGLILSFKQDMTRAAAEGARAGAVAFPADQRRGRRGGRARRGGRGLRRFELGEHRLRARDRHDLRRRPSAAVRAQRPGPSKCVTVTLVYDYDGVPRLR